MTEVVVDQEKIKKKFSDAIHHCIDILKMKRDYITDHCDEIQSRKSFLLGQEMFEFFKEMRQQLILKEINSCQPVITKGKLLDKQSSNSVKKYFVYIRPEERRAADIVLKNLDQKKSADIKLEDDVTDLSNKVEEVENNLSLQGERPRKRRATRPVVVDSSDSEDYNDDSDYINDDSNDSASNYKDFGLDYDALEEKREKKRQRTNLHRSSVLDIKDSKTNETESITTSNSSNTNGDNHDAEVSDINISTDEDDDENKNSGTAIPFAIKLNVVKISRENPDWSWKKIKEHTKCRHIHGVHIILKWQKIVDNGGSDMDKREFINQYVYKNCMKMKKKSKKFSNKMLIDWFIEGQDKYLPKNYSRRYTQQKQYISWLPRFKKFFKITGQSPNLQASGKFNMEHFLNESDILNMKNFIDSFGSDVCDKSQERPETNSSVSSVCFNDEIKKEPQEANESRDSSVSGSHEKAVGEVNFIPANESSDDKTSSGKNKKIERPQKSKTRGEDQSPVGNFAESEEHDEDRNYNVSGDDFNMKETEDMTSDSFNDEDDDESDDDISIPDKKHIPFATRLKVVKMAREHPDWSWEKIRKESGCSRIKNDHTINEWKSIIEDGGTRTDRRNFVKQYVYHKFIETKKKKIKIDNNKLVDWLFEAQDKYMAENDPLRFTRLRARRHWVTGFKNKYNIHGPAHDLQLFGKIQNDYDKNDIEVNIGSIKNLQGGHASTRVNAQLEKISANDKISKEKNDTHEPEKNKKNSTHRKTALSITDNIKTEVNCKLVPTTKKREALAKKKLIIPYEEKVTAVTLAIKHPKWPVKKIIKHADCKFLKTPAQIRDWAKHLACGGARDDRLTVMNRWIYSRCLERTNNHENFCSETLVKWAMEAQNTILKEILPMKKSNKHNTKFNCKFHDSVRWLADFKNNYNIAGNSPNHYVEEDFINDIKNSKFYDFFEDSPDAPIVVDVGNGMKILKIDRNLLKEYIKSFKRKKYRYVFYEDKVNAVKMFKENPDWSLEMIRKNIKGCENLESIDRIKEWEKQIKSGPTKYDKKYAINDWVYKKCLEHKKNNGRLYSELIKGWLTEAKRVVMPGFISQDLYRNSQGWLVYFRKWYNIIGYATDLQLGSLSDPEDADNDDEDEESDDDSDDPGDEDTVEKKKYVPLEEKLRVLKLAKENPTWTIKQLKKKSGCKYSIQLKLWKEHVKRGTRFDYMNKCDNYIYAKCLEYKKKNRSITNALITIWSREANKLFKTPDFNAKHMSIKLFKKRHNITGHPSRLIIEEKLENQC